jgi:hypothetical protein
MDGIWGDKKRGMDLEDLVCRNQDETSEREARWE